MNTVSRTLSTLLASSLVLLFAIGAAGAAPIDGLETRFGSGESTAGAPGTIDGLEVRYGSGQATAATATSAAHLDGLEARFAGAPAPDTHPFAGVDGDRVVGVAVPVMVGVVALAIVLASGFGYLAGSQRRRQLAHA